MEKITIRKFVCDDAEQCAKLNCLVWKQAYSHIFPKQVFELQQQNIANKIQMFKSGINDDNILTYVAEYNGEIVGYVSGSLISQYELFAQNGYAEMLAIYINPDFQQKGIAKQFRQFFLEWLKLNCISKYVVGVLEQNQKARLVYEKWGGVLADNKQSFEMLGNNYSEVFYTYTI